MKGTPAEPGLFANNFDGGDETVSLKTQEPLEKTVSGWSDFEQLEDLIGSEAAWKIAEVFAGTTIYIPKNILANRNYHIIRKKFKAGSTYRELGLEFGYTETHIRNIIHRKKVT